MGVTNGTTNLLIRVHRKAIRSLLCLLAYRSNRSRNLTEIFGRIEIPPFRCRLRYVSRKSLHVLIMLTWWLERTFWAAATLCQTPFHRCCLRFDLSHTLLLLHCMRICKSTSSLDCAMIKLWRHDGRLGQLTIVNRWFWRLQVVHWRR